MKSLISFLTLTLAVALTGTAFAADRETVEMRTSPTIRPITPLRRLLAEHHDICERILDEEEMDAGLWAYRKRTQKRRTRASL
jgi:hypothetical protein